MEQELGFQLTGQPRQRRTLKVAHFSFGAIGGGAARAAYRLHANLKLLDVDGRMYVLRDGSNDASVFDVTRHSIFRSLASEIYPRLDVLPVRLLHPRSRSFFSTGSFSASNLNRLLNFETLDIVCLYWVARGLLSISNVGKLLSTGKPVVWRLSDMWPFTGGCHYSGECGGFTDTCGHCPQLRSKRKRDLSSFILRRKKRKWLTENLTIVAPSNWMAEQARASSLFRSARCEVIHTGVDIETFRSSDRGRARERLGLPDKAPIVLFGATSALLDSRKGGDVVTEVVKLLWQDRKSFPECPVLAIYGTAERPVGIPDHVPVFPLGVLRDDGILADAYSAADVFLAPSRDENLANSVLEAMACGLPVVAFRVGGMSDAIEHEVTGILVDRGDIVAMGGAVTALLRNDMTRKRLSSAARARAVGEFSATVEARRYRKLFDELSQPLLGVEAK